MSKAIWHEKQILIVLLWSGLIFIGYNVLTAAEATTDDKKSEIKKICKGFDGGSWDDDSSKCKFSKEAIKIEDDAEFDHVLSDRGLGEAYLDGIAAKEDKEKLTGYDEEGRQLNVINGDYDDEEPKQKIEDWRNEVQTEEENDYQIPSTTTVYENEEDREEQEKEIKEFNEAQDEDTESEDNSSGGEEDDEPEEQDEPEEEEQDEPEEEEEESESEE